MLEIREIIKNALKEDIGPGDVTTAAVADPGCPSQAGFLAKEEFILAGLDVARQTFLILDPEVRFFCDKQDGERIQPGEIFAHLEGSVESLLQGERVALNFLQRMSGIATLTRRFVEAVAGTPVVIVDTRKTTPGLRVLEKYAVRTGGGRNHRFSLSDGVLIKENHIVASGGISVAVNRARKTVPHTLKIEVETRNLDEVKEALEAGADIVLLDNMTPETIREAVEVIGGRALVEISGGVTLKTVRPLAELGVDFISVGALTHSSRAVDISLLFSVTG